MEEKLAALYGAQMSCLWLLTW